MFIYLKHTCTLTTVSLYKVNTVYSICIYVSLRVQNDLTGNIIWKEMEMCDLVTCNSECYKNVNVDTRIKTDCVVRVCEMACNSNRLAKNKPEVNFKH